MKELMFDINIEVICKTTTIEEIFKDEIPTKLIKNGDKINGQQK